MSSHHTHTNLYLIVEHQLFHYLKNTTSMRQSIWTVCSHGYCTTRKRSLLSPVEILLVSPLCTWVRVPRTQKLVTLHTELKCLTDECDEIFAFPPGHVYDY